MSGTPKRIDFAARSGILEAHLDFAAEAMDRALAVMASKPVSRHLVEDRRVLRAAMQRARDVLAECARQDAAAEESFRQWEAERESRLPHPPLGEGQAAARRLGRGDAS